MGSKIIKDFKFKENQIFLTFNEAIDKDLLSIRITSYDKYINWDDQKQTIELVKHAVDFKFSFTYPDREIEPGATAVIDLNSYLCNYLEQQTKTFQFELFYDQISIKISVIAGAQFNKETETPTALEEINAHYIGKMKITNPNDLPEIEQEDEDQQLDDPLAFEEETVSTITPIKENNINRSDPNKFSFEEQLDDFVRNINQNNFKNVSNILISRTFYVGISIGVLLILLCLIFSNNHFNDWAFLIPNQDNILSFVWVSITIVAFIIAIIGKYLSWKVEDRNKAQIINEKLVLEIKNNIRQSKDLVDRNINELKNKEHIQEINLFAQSLTAVRLSTGEWIYASKDSARDYFNEDLIGSHSLHFTRMFMPTFLTAIGVLGTFVGLLYGLKDLNLHEIDQIQQQIANLTKGASTAFITSIWGVGLSIIYTLVITCAKHFSLQKFSNLQNNIDLVFCPYFNTEDQISVQAAIQRLDQNIQANLEQSSSQISDKIAKSVTQYIANVNNQTVEQVRVVVDEFKKQFLAILENQSSHMEAAANKLVKAQDQVAEGIKQKYNEWEADHANLISLVTQKYDALQSSSTSFISKLDSVDQHFNQIADSFTQLSQKNEALIQNASANQSQMSVLVGELSAKIEEINNLFLRSGEFQKEMLNNSNNLNEYLKKQSQNQQLLNNLIMELRNANQTISLFKGEVTQTIRENYERLNQKNIEILKANIDSLNNLWVDVVKNNMTQLREVLGDLKKVER